MWGGAKFTREISWGGAIIYVASLTWTDLEVPLELLNFDQILLSFFPGSLLTSFFFPSGNAFNLFFWTPINVLMVGVLWFRQRYCP
jgi:hypothetical protein